MSEVQTRFILAVETCKKGVTRSHYFRAKPKGNICLLSTSKQILPFGYAEQSHTVLVFRCTFSKFSRTPSPRSSGEGTVDERGVTGLDHGWTEIPFFNLAKFTFTCSAQIGLKFILRVTQMVYLVR